MRIEYHRTLIADRIRMDAFRSALARVIRRGETVVSDIGAGTGILGFLAARLGAKRVYLYESEAVADVARRIAKLNRLSNCEVVPLRSTEVIDPPRADVVVSETLGNYALEEGIIATIDDARRRHLKPGGVLLPSMIEQYVAPVVTGRVHEELTVWNTIGDDLDFTPARTMSLNNMYVRRLLAGELHGGSDGARRWDAIDLSAKCSSRRKGEVRWPVDDRAIIYGFALWWSISLGGGISLATGPFDPPTHWEQLYLPLLEPITVPTVGELALSLSSRTSDAEGTTVTWAAVLRDARGHEIVRQALDLEKGFLP